MALDTYLQNIDIRRGVFFIDVALELLSDGNALIWRKDAHHYIAGEAIGVPAAQATAFTTSSRHCQDPSSHLTAFAGFHTTPRQTQSGPFDIHYLQAYTPIIQTKGITGNLLPPKWL
jgi:hypothetical protein